MPLDRRRRNEMYDKKENFADKCAKKNDKRENEVKKFSCSFIKKKLKVTIPLAIFSFVMYFFHVPFTFFFCCGSFISFLF